MKKILLLLSNFRGGGAERLMLDLGYGFRESGHEVQFGVMAATGEFLGEACEGFRVIDLKAERARGISLPFKQLLRAEHYDAVLVAMWPLTAIAPVVAKLAGFSGTIAVSEHGVLSAQYRDWGTVHRLGLEATVAIGYRCADLRIAVSEAVAADMAQLSKLSRADFLVVHNAVRRLPTPTAYDLQAAEKLWGKGRPRLLAVGRLKAVKNYELLLQAFAGLKEPEAVLLFVGEGESEPALRELANALGVAERVRFAGFHADPTAFYASADRFVLSSDHEGFGNVLVEALACGLPVVSTDCASGPREILGAGRYGLLAEVGNVDSLRRAIETSLASEPDRALLKRRAQEFSIERTADRYLEAFGFR